MERTYKHENAKLKEMQNAILVFSSSSSSIFDHILLVFGWFWLCCLSDSLYSWWLEILKSNCLLSKVRLDVNLL